MKDGERNERSKTSGSEVRKLAKWTFEVLKENTYTWGFSKSPVSRSLEGAPG